jgi:hypothetical protein
LHHDPEGTVACRAELISKLRDPFVPYVDVEVVRSNVEWHRGALKVVLNQLVMISCLA